MNDIHTVAFEWWRTHGRVLPWRDKEGAGPSIGSEKKREKSVSGPTLIRDEAFASYFAQTQQRDPYRVIVSEVMLQQTQVDRVLPKFQAWMTKWPTIGDLAAASLAEVIIFWQGLGYNRRARFLWLMAKEIVHNYGGEWPRTEPELVKLPGVGKYTARAILSFAFQEQVAVVDTNVKRVLARLLDGKEVKDVKRSEKEWFALADAWLPADGQGADPWNQFLMDFGALVCTAAAPRCSDCPLRAHCAAQRRAIDEGFAKYSDKLTAEKTDKKSTKGLRKKSIRFEDTDRYVRGRIVDLLRERSIPRAYLYQWMKHELKISSRSRVDRALLALEREGIISTEQEHVALAMK